MIALHLAAQRNAKKGVSRRSTAHRVGVAASTVGDWSRQHANGTLETKPRGRPPVVVTAARREAIGDVLDETKGRIGVPSLMARFEGVPRAVLETMVSEHRRLHLASQEVLTWLVPGTVWTMDYTELDAAVDGTCGSVLSVRDLASTEQLAALPVTEQTADHPAAMLTALFAKHDAPLVVKTDNGSHFTASAVTRVLGGSGATHLRSPPATPRYNGAVEAGIGRTKARLLHVSAANGRPGSPTSDDLEAARLEGNAESRPWGPRGPSPDERWNQRPVITSEQRAAFLAAVAAATIVETQHHLDTCGRLPSASPCAAAPSDPASCLTEPERAMVARRSIRRALVELGYLTTRRTATSSTKPAELMTEN